MLSRPLAALFRVSGVFRKEAFRGGLLASHTLIYSHSAWTSGARTSSGGTFTLKQCSRVHPNTTSFTKLKKKQFWGGTKNPFQRRHPHRRDPLRVGRHYGRGRQRPRRLDSHALGAQSFPKYATVEGNNYSPCQCQVDCCALRRFVAASVVMMRHLFYVIVVAGGLTSSKDHTHSHTCAIRAVVRRSLLCRNQVSNPLAILTCTDKSDDSLYSTLYLQTKRNECKLTPSTPAVPNCCCSKGLAPYTAVV